MPRTYAQAETVVVDTESLHIRSGPGLTHRVTGSLKNGERVNVLAASGDWLQIQSEHHEGWIASWLTSSDSTAEITVLEILSRVDGLNVRATPTTGSAVLARMNAGDKAIMTGQDGQWAAIEFNGIAGWVHTDYITETAMPTVTQTEEKHAITSKEPQSFTVAVNALNVRKKADLSSKRIALIQQGETYAIKEINGNWVRISIGGGKTGWVYSFHGTLSTNNLQSTSPDAEKTTTVTILTNGTNLREAPTTSSQIVTRADAGEKLTVIKEADDWYEVSLPSGETAFVANWVVSTDEEEVPLAKPTKKEKKARVPGTLKGLTIVIDPGHGGNDKGTTGARGTDEKGITLQTADLLASKLQAAGATVLLTRETDTYIALRKRVAISHQYEADAFISIHYDANPDSSIAGFTTFYTQSSQRELASAVNAGLGSAVSLRNRGTQPADYLVLRENKQNAILIELGFLSNPAEERAITTDIFREQATHGIYKGLLDYFNSNLE